MKILFNTYVAHGLNSGQEFAKRFSNSMESNESSLGFYETEDTYLGKNGYSLHLQGLEKGFNNNAVYTEKNKKVFITAVKDIPAGAEIFVTYGKEYWDIIRHNRKIDSKSNPTG